MSSIAYLDVTPAFRRRAQAGEQLFFETDGHPNRAGYRLIANEILAHLTQKASGYGLILGRDSQRLGPDANRLRATGRHTQHFPVQGNHLIEAVQ